MTGQDDIHPDAKKIIDMVLSEHITRINLVLELNHMAMGTGIYAGFNFEPKTRACLYMAAQMLMKHRTGYSGIDLEMKQDKNVT